jgi:hypothetical protein
MIKEMTNKKPSKSVTKPVLRHLNDNSGGGFILFSIDENGLPEMNSHFETNAKALALQYYIQNWGKALESINVEAMSQMMEDKGDDENDGSEEI